jgi:hypothetical protein
VNAEMVSVVQRHCDHYVECTTKRGLPQLLADRFTKEKTTISDPWQPKPWTHNWYYPSPEMHEVAANALEPACHALTRMGVR